MREKILILGATGFIGRNMAEYFANKSEYEVFGTYNKSIPLNHANIKMLKADLTRSDDIEKVMQGVDIVIQAAATTSGAKDIVSKPYMHVTDNAVMNSLITRIAYEHSVKHVIVFSCSIMYQSSEVPLKETDFNPNNEMHMNYFGAGWMKVFVEKMCEFYSRLNRNKYTVLRHSNIYGPHDKFDLEKSHVFGATVTKVMAAKEGGKIRVWGTGDEERDLLYASDLTRCVDLAISKQEKPFALYNVGYGRSISVKDLVSKIIELSGKKLVSEHDLSKPSISTKVCLDCTKAKEELGWVPRVSLDDGIRKTLAWYKENVLAKGRQL